MANKKLTDLLNEAAEEAEAARGHDEDAPLPPHVNVSRPNRARSKVLQVRLTPEEFDVLERMAERRDLPVSTIAREQLLRLIAEGRVDSPRDVELMRQQVMLLGDIVADLAGGLGLSEIATTRTTRRREVAVKMGDKYAELS
ncbi:hypothetical protein C1Y40_04123 [Mycobacterium talmoniae]|uniref:Uncharacterized protein n=1 Tax=Mycobacterium talmoniae TaxID=1858794 RepID=A0A2S8BGC9_9MYCO|nr:hypothetical protein C1Y40_04123 [Mycobacterium talmoniae]